MTLSERRTAAFTELRAIAASWGWKRLRFHRHEYKDPTTHRPRSVVWHTSGQDDWCRRKIFYLQINECPIGQQRRFTVAVYAPRFRICSGWYFFRLSNRTIDRRRISALGEVVGKHHFDSPSGRRAFRAAHPECVGYLERRITRCGAPFEVVDATDGITEPNRMKWPR